MQKHAIRKRKGFALILVLGAIAVTTTLGLSYLQKVSIGTSATATRFAAMQADYLAEAAANHALWRILNDPGFPASQTVYYMHDLDNGRYGYKVRPPTLTKFATVAAVGAVGDVVAKQSYVQYIKPYNIFTVYEPWGGAALPAYRQLLAANWADPADAISIGANDASYIVVKGCPIRNEIIMGALDAADDINFAIWDGSAWGNLTEFTSDTGGSGFPCFDVAYESQSGDALVIGRYNDTASTRYNTWNGSLWIHGTAQEEPALQTGSTLAYADMASNPNSDEILIALVDLSNDLNMIQWDGTSFNFLGEIDTDTGTDDYGCVEVVYEQQTGDVLVLWNHKNASQIYYSLWNGATLSAPALLPFDFGGNVYPIRAAASPNVNFIVAGATDKFYDLSVAIWNGDTDTWIDSRELDTYVFIMNEPTFDIAWEQSGDEVLIAWLPWGPNNMRYLSWRPGTNLADQVIKDGPSPEARLMRIYPISGSEKIVLLTMNNPGVLHYCLWTGSAVLGNPSIELHNSIAGGILPFDLAEPNVSYNGISG